MKKILSIILIALILITMVSCSGSFSLYKSGTQYLYGEKYSYKIHSLKESGNQSSVVNITFKNLEGDYVYDLYIKGYSCVFYTIEVENQDLTVSVIESGELLELPRGTIDVSSFDEKFIHIVFSAELCESATIQFVLTK